MLVYKKLSDFIFDCSVCPTRCDDKSRENYIFDDDAEFSGFFEQQIIDFINFKTPYHASKLPDKSDQPDLEISLEGTVRFYIEVKVQSRAFMMAHKLLKGRDLMPSATLALNRSDLVHYINFKRANHTKVYIMWALLDRPCIVNNNEIRFFYQNLSVLQDLFERYGDKRMYKRRQGTGDVVNGKALGVKINYHFSITELKEWKPLFGPKLIQKAQDFINSRKT